MTARTLILSLTAGLFLTMGAFAKDSKEAAMHKNANRILQMIRDKNLREFDRRTAMRNCRYFKTAAEIQPVLDFLDDYGYIIRQPDKNTAFGRPPLPKYTVNPSLFPKTGE